MNGQIRFEEETALVALKRKLPNKFSRANILIADMPDIQMADKSVGVEVVIGYDRDLFRILSMNKLIRKKQVADPVAALKRMGVKRGYRIRLRGNRTTVIPDAGWGSQNDVKLAIQSKVVKASSYTQFEENDLFIHVLDAPDEIQTTIGVVATMSEMPFKYIYLWDGNHLIEVSTAEKSAVQY